MNFTKFHPIKTKCVNINFKKFFWEKLLTECFRTSMKLLEKKTWIIIKFTEKKMNNNNKLGIYFFKRRGTEFERKTNKNNSKKW